MLVIGGKIIEEISQFGRKLEETNFYPDLLDSPMEYEYKVISTLLLENENLPVSEVGDRPRELEAVLNKLGAKGWELVQTITRDGVTVALVFLRRI